LLGPATAAQITSLSQGELAQLQQIVDGHDDAAFRRWAAEDHFD